MRDSRPVCVGSVVSSTPLIVAGQPKTPPSRIWVLPAAPSSPCVTHIASAPASMIPPCPPVPVAPPAPAIPPPPVPALPLPAAPPLPPLPIAPPAPVASVPPLLPPVAPPPSGVLAKNARCPPHPTLSSTAATAPRKHRVTLWTVELEVIASQRRHTIISDFRPARPGRRGAPPAFGPHPKWIWEHRRGCPRLASAPTPWCGSSWLCRLWR